MSGTPNLRSYDLDSPEFIARRGEPVRVNEAWSLSPQNDHSTVCVKSVLVKGGEFRLDVTKETKLGELNVLEIRDARGNPMMLKKVTAEAVKW